MTYHIYYVKILMYSYQEYKLSNISQHMNE